MSNHKSGDKIILQKHIFIPKNSEWKVFSIFQEGGEENYKIKKISKKTMLLNLSKLDFERLMESNSVIKEPKKKEILPDDLLLFKKEFHAISIGRSGILIKPLSPTDWLCKFDDEIVQLSEDQFIEWNPEEKEFELHEKVRVLKDLPEIGVKKGTEGAIIDVYFEPKHAYSVEFLLEEAKEGYGIDYESCIVEPKYLDRV